MNTHYLIKTWASLLRVSQQDIVTLILRAPYQYKHYQIPKRTGGMRDIYHPTPNLKAIQRWLVQKMLHKLPVHDSVYSYRIGSGIRDHAAVHLHSNFLMRLDFSDFFPSLDDAWLREFLLVQVGAGNIDVEPETIPLLIRIICRFSKHDKTMALSIGAPSSPMLSNAILFAVDDQAKQQCSALDCIYTRYADDLYVSARKPDCLRAAETELRKIVAEIAPRLRINEAKTTNVSKKTTRVVTGLVLTPDRKVSVGREMKRRIKTQVYLSASSGLSQEEFDHLCGLVAYVRDVEPTFFEALTAKFGEVVMQRLLRRGAE